MTFEELDRLFGEELPPRTVLSSVASAGSDELYPLLVRTEHGTTVAYACQYKEEPGGYGLLASLGLAPSTPGHTITCVPAAISQQ
ncbi:hypothetical protein CTZ27_25350 [Streptomyces griseocarneus]|nr:hypothetical protein CTZ27_25350 [Streptomyces griseocarneus]